MYTMVINQSISITLFQGMYI